MEDKEIMNLSENVKEEVEKKEQENQNVKGGNGETEKFVGLPIESLICKPMVAAAQGQQELRGVYIDGMKKFAYKEDSNSEINTLEFTYERPIINPDDSQGEPIKATIKAPLLSLIPVPAFTMDETTVDFNMEVKEMDMADSKTHEDTSDTVNYSSWFDVKCSITGKVTPDKECNEQKDSSATDAIHARAVQQPSEEGMEKLTALLSQAMEPIKADSE